MFMGKFSAAKKHKGSLKMWNILAANTRKTFAEKEVQTIIQKKINEDSRKLSSNNEKTFYSLLEYTPYNSIQRSNLKIINLSKFQSMTSVSAVDLKQYLFMDDDGISELCVELRERIRKGTNKKLETFKDSEAQTDLHVEPHVLEDEQVARVVVDSCVQTDF